MRTIIITTAEGFTIPIQFHREANRCWHVLMPNHVDTPPVPDSRMPRSWDGESYTYRGPRGELVIACSSLSQAMENIMEYINQTEF